ATTSRLGAWMQSMTSRAAACTRRCAATRSSALERTDASRLTISRTTRATDASRSATRTIASTYSSGVRAWPAMASTHLRAGRQVAIEREHRQLPVGRGGQHHPVRLHAHELRRLQIGDDDDFLPHELGRRIAFGDAGHERPLLGAE